MSNLDQNGKMPMGTPQDSNKGTPKSNLKTGESGGGEMSMIQRKMPLTGKMGTKMPKS